MVIRKSRLKNTIDLNEFCRIKTGEISDRSNSYFQEVKVKVCFKDLSSELIKHIRKADAVFGCVAWLTSKEILNALSRINSSIIVHKEDFLRTDLKSRKVSNYSRWLRSYYSNLKCLVKLKEFPSDIIQKYLDQDKESRFFPLRCAGIKGKGYRNPTPRCHHKFLVFCSYEKEKLQRKGNWGNVIPGKIIPTSVWTGSFNFTENSGNSLENSVILYDVEIAQKYLEEYARVYSISERIDWVSPIIFPEFKIKK